MPSREARYAAPGSSGGCVPPDTSAAAGPPVPDASETSDVTQTSDPPDVLMSACRQGSAAFSIKESAARWLERSWRSDLMPLWRLDALV